MYYYTHLLVNCYIYLPEYISNANVEGFFTKNLASHLETVEFWVRIFQCFENNAAATSWFSISKIVPYGSWPYVAGSCHENHADSMPAYTQTYALTRTKSTILTIFWKSTFLIPAWISNFVRYIVWGEITYPFQNFNGCTARNDVKCKRQICICPNYSGPKHSGTKPNLVAKSLATDFGDRFGTGYQN